jgi:hypothetical protein
VYISTFSSPMNFDVNDVLGVARLSIPRGTLSALIFLSNFSAKKIWLHAALVRKNKQILSIFIPVVKIDFKYPTCNFLVKYWTQLQSIEKHTKSLLPRIWRNHGKGWNHQSQDKRRPDSEWLVFEWHNWLCLHCIAHYIPAESDVSAIWAMLEIIFETLDYNLLTQLLLSPLADDTSFFWSGKSCTFCVKCKLTRWISTMKLNKIFRCKSMSCIHSRV